MKRAMRIKDITLDDIRGGKNWKVVLPEDGVFPEAIPLEEVAAEEADEFGPGDYIAYSSIFVTGAGEVKPLVMIKLVADLDYGGDYCEFVDGRWRQLGLEPDPHAPSGEEYVANPLEQDPSFVSEDDYRKAHREGFKKYISLL